MRSWGLKPRFLILTLCLFLAAGALSFVLFLATARGIVESLGTRFAVMNTRLARSRILALIEPEVALSRRLADSPAVKAWMLDEANPDKAAAARAELESYRKAFGDHSYFVAIRASNTYYNQQTDGERVVAKLSPAIDPWFYRTLATVRDWELNLDYDAHIRATKVWINCVVSSANVPIGLAGSGIDITGFVADLAQEAQEGLSVMLIDSEGNITAHRNLDLLLKNAHTKSGSTKLKALDLAASAPDRTALEALLEGISSNPDEVRTTRIGFEGARSLIAASSLAGTGWTILAAVDMDRILSVRSFALIPVVFLAALVLLIIALALMVDRLILLPLGSLTSAAREVALGRIAPPAAQPPRRRP